MSGPLITVSELRDVLGNNPGACVLDMRWRLDRPEGRPDYLDGHIPGAVYVDLEQELAHRDDPAAGRHPVPARERLEASARRWGVRTGETVYVYDDLQSVAAARAWWLLRGSGVDVRVVDGGLRAWLAEDLPLQTGDTEPAAWGDITLQPLTGELSSHDAALTADRGVLIDTRHRRLYRGDDDPLDPVAGHIPGARNLPTTVHQQDGRFYDAERIRSNFALVGAVPGRPVGAYCGSGVASAHTVLAGTIAGLDVGLYAGSWSQWSRTRGLQYAVGASPRGVLLPV